MVDDQNEGIFIVDYGTGRMEKVTNGKILLLSYVHSVHQLIKLTH